MKKVLSILSLILVSISSLAIASDNYFSQPSYSTIQDEGSSLAKRRILNFIGAGVSCVDNSGSNRTDCTIGGGGGSSVVVEENDVTVEAAATNLDFLGADFDITSSPSGEANVVIAGAITRDAEWDTIGEIETATGVNIIVSTEIDTLAELETLEGSINIIAATEIDTSAEIAAIVTNETGTGLLVFATSPVFTTPNIGVATGSVSGTSGNVADADYGDISVSGGVWSVDANAVALGTDTTGNYVATIADSGASEVTVANSGSETAGVTLALASGITRDTEWDTEGEVQTAWGSVNIILATEIDTSAELSAILTDETGTAGKFVMDTSPSFSTGIGVRGSSAASGAGINLASTAATSGEQSGMSGVVTNSRSGTDGPVAGIDTTAIRSGTTGGAAGTGDIWGVKGLGEYSSTGTQAQAFGVYGDCKKITSASGVITNCYSLFGTTPTAAGGGTVTNPWSLGMTGKIGWTSAEGTDPDTNLYRSGANVLTTDDGFTSTATGAIGWSIVAGANTACNTTCTNACVMGFAQAVTGSDPVACTDATADNCLCAGAS